MLNFQVAIPIRGAQIIIGIFFALAILAAIIRLSIRLRIHRRLFLDDPFLILACATLIPATVLTFDLLPTLYFDQALAEDPVFIEVPKDFISNAIWYSKIWDATSPLTWTTLYAVKFSFLIFFRKLTARMENMKLYVTVVMVMCALSYFVSLCEVWINRPHVGAYIARCSNRYNQTVAISIVIIIMDILVDIMIFTIPFRLLYQIKLDLRQKVKIGFCLCIGIINILIAILRSLCLRMTTDQNASTLNNTWGTVWVYVEICVAVIVVSITAFRSLFIFEAKRSRERKPSPKWSSKEKLWRRKGLGEYQTYEGLPSIPSATLSGLRTLFSGGPQTSSKASNIDHHLEEGHGEEDGWPLRNRQFSLDRSAGASDSIRVADRGVEYLSLDAN